MEAYCIVVDIILLLYCYCKKDCNTLSTVNKVLIMKIYINKNNGQSKPCIKERRKALLKLSFLQFSTEACLQPSKTFAMKLKAVNYFCKAFQIVFYFYQELASRYFVLRRILDANCIPYFPVFCD